jgi:hypothetical protein
MQLIFHIMTGNKVWIKERFNGKEITNQLKILWYYIDRKRLLN